MLTIKHEMLSEFNVLHLDGALDASTCGQFDQEIINVTENKTSLDTMIELKNLSYLSSAGLRSLVILFKKLAGQKKKLCLIEPQPLVKEILSISGFTKLMTIYPSIETAKEAIH